ncbi:MAG: hypothetical protein HYV26_03540 [Candidatus Hydrogenedentes bacterium]|nr:hypothetical protein [Candidatus Hydrogenedentota bacterium]
MNPRRSSFRFVCVWLVLALPRAFPETLQEIGARLGKESSEAYTAGPFASLSKDYFARFQFDPDTRPGEGEVQLSDGTIYLPPNPAPVTPLMAGYLQDFLIRRMQMIAEIKEGSDPAAIRSGIVLNEHGGDAAVVDSFTIAVSGNVVEISGNGPNGLRDGIVKLVDLIGFRGAPILKLGSHTCTPRLPVRLGTVPNQGSYRELVFLGYNAVFAGGGNLHALSTSDAIPELAVRRQPGMPEANRKGAEEARKHGLMTYAFVDTRQKFPESAPVFQAHPEVRGARTWSADGEFTLCTSHPLVQQWLRESVAGVYQADPDLNGMVLIIGGEGFYHCYMRPFGVEKGHTNCARCEPLGAETVVANLCTLLAEAARSVRADAEIVVWPYSAEHVWSADKTQEQLIAKLKPGVSLLTEIEKDEYVQKPGGVNKHLWDYSIDLIGPGERAKKQIAACRAAGINVYLKSEPELGFEAPRLPQVPCMDRWLDRAEALASCGATGAWVFPAFRPNYGTSTTEINKFVWWTPVPEKEALLQQFAARLVGPAAGPNLREAWKHVSEAIPLSPVIPPYYTGPQYLGPAHPMVLDPEAPLPDVFNGYYLFLAEMNDAAGMKKRPTYDTKPFGDAEVFGDYYRRMEAALKAAVDALEQARPLVPESHRLLLEAELSPTRWFYHTTRTTANFYEACPLRDQLRACGQDPSDRSDQTEVRAAALRLREIMLDEQANTLAALPLVEADMRLDCYYGGDHTFSHAADMMRAKLEILGDELAAVLPEVVKKCEVPPAAK